VAIAKARALYFPNTPGPRSRETLAGEPSRLKVSREN
jgi:hypothetical protein